MIVVDSFTPKNDPIADPAGRPAAGSGVRGYLATRNGKLVVGGLVVLLIVAAAAAILFNLLMSQPAPPEGFTTPGGSVPATSTAAGQTTPTVPPVPALDETFMFRNVFAPTVEPDPGTAPSSGGTTTDGNTDTSGDTPDTLYLLSLSTQDGAAMATFRLNGTQYIVGEGDRLGDTPWSVVSITSTQVVLLYGDTRVTISLGQGVSK